MGDVVHRKNEGRLILLSSLVINDEMENIVPDCGLVFVVLNTIVVRLQERKQVSHPDFIFDFELETAKIMPRQNWRVALFP